MDVYYTHRLPAPLKRPMNQPQKDRMMYEIQRVRMLTHPIPSVDDPPWQFGNDRFKQHIQQYERAHAHHKRSDCHPPQRER